MNARPSGALALRGISAVPSETASTLFVSSGSDPDGKLSFQAGQLGGGFTVSKTFPLCLEGYIGYNRYDPRFVLSDGTASAPLNLKWTGVAAPGGVGWDFKPAEDWTLRPMVNVSLGQVVSDTASAIPPLSRSSLPVTSMRASCISCATAG